MAGERPANQEWSTWADEVKRYEETTGMHAERSGSAGEYDAEAAFNDALDELKPLLYALAETRGITLTDSRRKDVTTFLFGDAVAVEFGEQSDRQRGFVGVANSSQFRMTTDFNQLLAPPPTVLLALVVALLDHEAAQPADD